ncbi:MAG: CDP-alcohol phosphatidyltransferase family protein [Proteobacteria bacterium]|nr:CDP-alcohol phosphatidyltransferase family protein [Pseudomonadota bacterium]
MSWFKHIPNTITIARIVAMIPLVWFMLEKQYDYAFYIAIAAGFSDVLDGFLAKTFGWEGWLGSVLDPLADKFMMLCCFLVFAVQGLIPNWLLITVLARDVIIVLGATIYHFTIVKVDKASPSMLSKINTALQILLIVIMLAHLSVFQFDARVIEYLIYLVTFFTITSGIHYVYYWGHKAIVAKEK